VLAPTRELALQITGELQQYAAKLPALRIATVYGGADIRRQIRQLNDGVHLIIATPGRLVDLINRQKVNLEGIRIAVLDEADEMLNMGFRDDLDMILENTPAEKVTWLFSATMSADVKSISQRYLQSPLEVTAGDRNTANSNIEHQYILLKRNQKYEALCRLLDYHPDFFGLLFCRTRRDTLQLAKQLTKDGYPADAINGDLSQAQREQVMDRFRNRQIKLLVATDVAARGIDVDGVTHVFNFNLPNEPEAYVHRIGRTGRAGATGMAVSFCASDERAYL
jgi:ATP-dependent RNA helicase DeaD